MDSLLRRKPSPLGHPGRRFDELPEDILILVLCYCSIDDLFTMRLSNSKFRDLILERIASIAPAVARATFPLNHVLLTPPDHPSLYSINWLQRLIPQQLASILVDRNRVSYPQIQQRYGIPAEDPFGDELRARVANGWCVLRQLSLISKEVYAMTDNSVSKSSLALAWITMSKRVRSSQYKYTVFCHREDLILDRRLQYIKELDTAHAKDYKLMFTLLSAVFRAPLTNTGEEHKPWVFDWGKGIDAPRLLRRGTSWVTWWILSEGADLFWKQWWMLPSDSQDAQHYIRDRAFDAWFEGCGVTANDFVQDFATKDWTDVNAKWHSVQCEHAKHVQEALHLQALGTSPQDHMSVDPVVYFSQYAEHRQRNDALGLAPVQETLSHVPFHVEFRCPPDIPQAPSAHRIAMGNALQARD